MLYLYIDSKQLKLLYTKKSMLGQYELKFFEKKHEIQLLEKGKVTDIDLVASAIKDGLNHIFTANNKEREVFLIIPQESFHFLRTEVPIDIAPSAVFSFIKDKARNTLSVDLDTCLFDFFVKENGAKKQITLFALEKDTLSKFQETASLLDLKLQMILPETLAYFKLFEKTLRKDKRENIFYVHYNNGFLTGYLYDSYGLLVPDKWYIELTPELPVGEALHQKTTQYESQGIKINRIILSGAESETIRQDTFTKTVGAWTNPLKRIIPNFYQNYLNMLVASDNKPFPILNLDMCFGAFIFLQEHKDFSLLKGKNMNVARKASLGNGFSVKKIFRKEIILFLVSFIVSYFFFVFMSKYVPGIQKNLFVSRTPTLTPAPLPTSTPIPTPVIDKEIIKIKVLNGSGTPGKASEVKNILIKQGYQEIVTGNADTFDYEITEIQVKRNKSELIGVFQNDLKDNVAKTKPGTLDEKETADVLIIIGKDFK